MPACSPGGQAYESCRTTAHRRAFAFVCAVWKWLGDIRHGEIELTSSKMICDTTGEEEFNMQWTWNVSPGSPVFLSLHFLQTQATPFIHVSQTAAFVQCLQLQSRVAGFFPVQLLHIVGGWQARHVEGGVNLGCQVTTLLFSGEVTFCFCYK